MASLCDREVAYWTEFRILCLKGSVISFISPSSGGLVQFSLYVHKGGLKPHSFHLHRARCMFSPDTNSTSMRCWVLCKMKTRFSARIARRDSIAWTDVCTLGSAALTKRSDFFRFLGTLSIKPLYYACVSSISSSIINRFRKVICRIAKVRPFDM